MAKYAKAVVASAGAVLIVLSASGLPFVGSGWFQGIVAIATAIGVYHVPNRA